MVPWLRHHLLVIAIDNKHTTQEREQRTRDSGSTTPEIGTDTKEQRSAWSGVQKSFNLNVFSILGIKQQPVIGDIG